MRRRNFLRVLGGAAAAWPLAARAQQPIRRIGVLMAHAENDAEFKAYVAAFHDGLERLGWSESVNIHIDFRWGALDDAAARERSAKELLALQPEVILTQNTPPTASMLQQTRAIPVVFVVVADPVGSGFVESLARPGGNATGFTVMEPSISGKWVESGPSRLAEVRFTPGEGLTKIKGSTPCKAKNFIGHQWLSKRDFIARDQP